MENAAAAAAAVSDAAMENLLRSLSPWARRLQEDFLAMETPTLRQLRHEAQDANTPADRLEEIARVARESLRPYDSNGLGSLPTLNAVARHPNTPPDRLLNLLNICIPDFCRNPVAPFLLLEMSNFAQRIQAKSEHITAQLLREENAPLSLVRAIATLPNLGQNEREAARCHIGIAGEVQSRAEWETEVERCWREWCIEYAAAPGKHDKNKVNERIAQMHCDLSEIGFAPRWAQEPPCWIAPSAPPVLPEVRAWLSFPFPAESTETKSLWRRVAPHLASKPHLARLAHKTASEEDLLTLLALPGIRTSSLRQIAVLHPNGGDRVMESLNDASQWRHDRMLRLFLTRPDCSAAAVAKLAAHSNAQVRRLARRHPNAPKDALQLSREAIVRFVDAVPKTDPTRFVQFSVGLQTRYSSAKTIRAGVNPFWGSRLLAALTLPVAHIDPYSGTNLAARLTTNGLLQHLARDGNRLVRWAAKARLDDPDFAFTWHEKVGNDRDGDTR